MPKFYKRHCDQCGQYYEGGKRFCSRNCAMRYRNIHNNPAKNPETRKKISASRKGKPTIVGKKHWNWQGGKWKIPKKCPDCGSNISYRAAFCKICSKKGDRSTRWKGGTTPQRIKEYATDQYKMFVKSVLERDNYTCQECGVTNGLGKTINFEVHHIESYAENPELRFDINNGITLCEECHWNTIRKHKKPNRTDKEFRLKKCVKCGKDFQDKGQYKICPECRILNCLFCGESFGVKNGKYDQRFCSETCYYKWFSKNKKGENNPNFRKVELRKCINCNQDIIRRNKEAIVTYNRRQFCSHRCVYDYRKKQNTSTFIKIL